MKLNVERQGEGGTLALNDVNNTTTMKKNQDLIHKSSINVFVSYHKFSVP
jgi:hypothetical protein